MSEITAPRWAQHIIEVHTDVTDAVSHVERMASERYFVWQEDGEDVFDADERHGETAVTGTTDLFTKREFDPWVRQFEESIDESPYVLAWGLESVQFEEDTGFYHYEWAWEVI